MNGVDKDKNTENSNPKKLSASKNTKDEGFFIAFEGGDGTGKTTQLTKLKNELTKEGYNVIATREPGGTDLGNTLRDIILNVKSSDDDNISAMTEAMLFAADRADHVDKLIKPALKDGKIVLSDRFVDSSIAYQGAGRNLGVDNISFLNELATGKLLPDLTILLDLDTSESCRRQQKRDENPDRIEAESDKFHARVREAFLRQAQQHPELYLVLDASNPAEDQAKIILEHVTALLPKQD